MYGMDASIPLAMQPPERVPRPTMENMVKLSGLLGVSVRWMLHGEPENDVDVFVMGPLPSGASLAATAATNGAAIISGASNSTVVVQNIRGDDLSGMEREMILTLRQLHPKDQAAAFSYVFALESSAAEQKEKAPST